ncbi:MAG: hypothetical protein V4632_23810 [Pseudomonadota bacterium]
MASEVQFLSFKEIVCRKACRTEESSMFQMIMFNNLIRNPAAIPLSASAPGQILQCSDKLAIVRNGLAGEKYDHSSRHFFKPGVATRFPAC